MPTAIPSLSSSASIDDFLDRPIRLASLELVEAAVPQVEVFRSAIGVRKERRALFVRWTDSDGTQGVGECSCRPDPFFNGEFLSASRTVIEDFVFPALPARGRIRDVVAVLSRVRNWSFTTAAVLDAAADLLRRKGVPDPIDLWNGPRVERIPVGISLGLFDDAGAAVERVGQEVEQGYRRIKLKIAPEMDLEVLRAVRAAFPAMLLAFDANGSFSDGDLDTLAALAELEPEAVEQPFPPDRLDLCCRLKEHASDLAICLDESLTGLGLLIAAHRLGALDEVNLKPGRVGGVVESLRMIDYAGGHGLPTWVGGMFETGVGRAKNLRIAACLPESRAHDLSPSKRYFTTDVVTQPITMGKDGCVEVPTRPVELDEEILERLTVERRSLVKE